MGDVVHALPLAADIKRARPDCTIDWLVEETFAGIPALSRHVDGVHIVALRRWRWRPFDTGVWHEVRVSKEKLRDKKYDLVIDAQGLAKSAWLARWTQSPIAGFDPAGAREPIAARFYRHRFSVPRELHAIERCRRLGALALGYEVEGPPAFGIFPGRMLSRGERRAILLVNASRAAKLWSEERWLAVERWLTEQGYASVLYGGSPDERQRAEHMVHLMQRAEVGPPSTLDAIALPLSSASIVIGLDTGLTHLAAALGRPTVGIFCDYDPTLTGIVGDAEAGNAVASVGSATAAPTAGEVIEAAMRVIGRAG